MSKEDVVKHFNNFSCSKNIDVENFLRNTSIRFEEADKSRTYIVIPKDDPIDIDGKMKILGYFSISNKSIFIPEGLSKTQVKKLDGLNKNASELKCYLIGQLGKNNKYKKLISGVELLENALNIIHKCYELLGMRVILIECANNENLINFYESNNFSRIGYDNETELLQLIITITPPKKDILQILDKEKLS